LIFFTYPLVRGLDERYEELLKLVKGTNVLFIVGDSDPLCIEMYLMAIRRRMSAQSWWVRLVGADYGIRYDTDEERDALCNIAGQIAAKWNEGDGGRDPEKTECTLGWNKERGEVEWTGWMEKPEDIKVL
jgi:hypothetical protein